MPLPLPCAWRRASNHHHALLATARRTGRARNLFSPFPAAVSGYGRVRRATVDACWEWARFAGRGQAGTCTRAAPAARTGLRGLWRDVGDSRTACGIPWQRSFLHCLLLAPCLSLAPLPTHRDFSALKHDCSAAYNSSATGMKVKGGANRRCCRTGGDGMQHCAAALDGRAADVGAGRRCRQHYLPARLPSLRACGTCLPRLAPSFRWRACGCRRAAWRIA